MLEMVTTDARKKAKNEGIAKTPSHRLAHVKNATISISSTLVAPAAISSIERFFFCSNSIPSGGALNGGILARLSRETTTLDVPSRCRFSCSQIRLTYDGEFFTCSSTFEYKILCSSPVTRYQIICRKTKKKLRKSRVLDGAGQTVRLGALFDFWSLEKVIRAVDMRSRHT